MRQRNEEPGADPFPCQETHSDDDEIACPKCGEINTDLFEVGRGDEGDHDMDCGHCDAPLAISRVVSVSYTATVRAAKGGA